MTGFSGRLGCCLVWVLTACATDPVDRALDEDGDGVGYAQDCDDSDATVGAPGLLYLDADGDGFGSQAAEVCPGLAGWVDQDGDCADQDATVYPGAPERCNGLDDDCDGLVDQDDDDLLLSDLDWYFVDADGDGWGAEAAQACAPTDGYSDREGDCDDGAASVHPEAPERCGNGIDDDCSGDANALTRPPPPPPPMPPPPGWERRARARAPLWPRRGTSMAMACPTCWWAHPCRAKATAAR